MPGFAKLKTLWVNGAIVLFIAAAVLGVSWLLLTAVIGLGMELIGASSARVGWWMAFASPLWAPLVFGSVLRGVPRSIMNDVWRAGLRS